MKVEYLPSFLKDLKALKSASLSKSKRSFLKKFPMLLIYGFWETKISFRIDKSHHIRYSSDVRCAMRTLQN